MHAVVVGAGMGGLAAATDLARQGHQVTVIDRAPGPGGKMRQLPAGPAHIDAGPTVFTMRWVFDSLFHDAGDRLTDRLTLIPAQILARHLWHQGGQLDLFADPNRSADAIAAFAGPAEARAFKDFMQRAARIYRTLEAPFMAAERPSMLDLARRVGPAGLPALLRTSAHRTLWSALGDHFRDPRLRQLFARYATYVGASPFHAPATLMLIANVEQDGVWLVQGGIHDVARALQALAERLGATFRFNAEMARIDIHNGRAAGITLATGEHIAADAIVFNGDISALDAALRPVPATPPRQRSLSAVTWCLHAPTGGIALDHHNVVFAEDYAREFDAIFNRRTPPDHPTIYICAQDRAPGQTPAPGTPERLLILVNAPADGDHAPLSPQTLAALETRTFALLAACGIRIDRNPNAQAITTPEGFHALFPGTGGALYGRANHGPTGSFARAGAAARLPGLYLAGGSVHPGPGIPMAALSGRIAAARLIQDATRTRTPIGFSPRRTGSPPPA